MYKSLPPFILVSILIFFYLFKTHKFARSFNGVGLGASDSKQMLWDIDPIPFIYAYFGCSGSQACSSLSAPIHPHHIFLLLYNILLDGHSLKQPLCPLIINDKLDRHSPTPPSISFSVNC